MPLVTLSTVAIFDWSGRFAMARFPLAVRGREIERGTGEATIVPKSLPEDPKAPPSSGLTGGPSRTSSSAADMGGPVKPDHDGR
ncbi:hypothetical protein GCM10008179_15340 [Hansschlegelia plantiphila]|uniref:Uncharacterized protein n=1 Tax=Hansschlegelia plantiphila TaxID=374655 RepID=A0A9W6J172_9HYPH|nr:hypothetical protein GCM10008179_15340 [Hansschlegelia plantiphila]